jgi:hypothetical protein
MTPDELKAYAEEKILWHYLAIDGQGKLLNPPKDDEELHEFIRLALGYAIPRKVVTPGHRAPFDFIADLFFERTKNALGFASRNGGKTIAVAILNFLDVFFKPGCEITSAGAILSQADRCYEYFLSFFHKPWFKKWAAHYQKVTGKKFVIKDIQSETKLANSSKLEIITASEKGFRGPHPQKNRVDEIDIIEWSVLQTGLSMAAGKNGIRGQNVFTSTRQLPDGPMQLLLDEATTRGIDVYEWNIWEALERCPRRCQNDPKFGTCPIYEFCKGKAHHCDGFYSIDDFVEKVRMLDKEKFEVEWLNEKPERSKLIYSMFNPTVHVMGPDQLKRMTGYKYPQEEWTHVGGIDFGSSPGHPFAYVKLCQLPSHGAWLLYYEYVVEVDLLRNHADRIMSSPNWSRSEPIYADWDAQDRLELANYGVATRQAEKDVEVGIDYVKSLLSGTPPKFTPILYVWHECKRVIKEFNSYQRKTMADGSIDASGKPLKRNDDALDAMRYALLSYRGITKQKVRAYRARV